MPENASSIEDIITRLQLSANSERKDHSNVYFPTAMEVIGVSVPDYRLIVKEIGKQLKYQSADIVLSYSREIIETGIFECRQIAYELIAGHKDTMKALGADDLEQLGAGMDNWASVDTFSVMVAGPTWRERRVPDELLIQWTQKDDIWWKRSSVVSTVALNSKARGGIGDPERTVMICTQVVGDHHPMIAKALSWSLRELSKRHRVVVETFLSTHAEDLAPLVIREVRRKIDTGRK